MWNVFDYLSHGLLGLILLLLFLSIFPFITLRVVFSHVRMPIICIAFRSLLLLLRWPRSAAPELLLRRLRRVRLVGGVLAHFYVLVFLIEAALVVVGGVLLIVHWRL